MPASYATQQLLVKLFQQSITNSFAAFPAARAASGIASQTVMISTGRHMQNRPKFLTLTQIKMPVPAIISIMHRVSGAVLFLALPLLLWVFQQSLTSFGDFTELRGFFANGLVKLIALGLIWGFFHHLCAGIRFLALDLHIGGDLEAARASSRLVLAGGIVLTLLAGWQIW